jgi:peptidoglycan/xylan/chitin deacetylase (PgdA/CDA1 family)
MMLVLTYHKVLENPKADEEFYTVGAARLREQLDTLAESGLQCLAPEPLVEGKTPSGPGYLLTFDDGTLDHYEVVLPLLTERRLKAVFFVPTAKLGRPGYLTASHAGEISQAGQTLGLHSHEHKPLDRLSEEEIRTQMELSHKKLTELAGRPMHWFAPPGGFFNANVRRVAGEFGVGAVRTMRWGYNRRLDLMALETVPLNRYSTAADFARAVKFQRRPAVYTMKQLVKAMLPLPLYERMRRRAFETLRKGQ